MALWLYLHFPSLQLDAITQHAGEQLPAIIIVDGKKNEVLQLTKTAVEHGIKIGMGLGSAASLCAQLDVRPYQEEIENNILKRIARWVYSISADIVLYPPNGLLLRVSSMLALHQSLADYWLKLSSHLNCLPFYYQYATGYSPEVARVLAKQGINQVSNDHEWINAQLKQQPISVGDFTPKVVARFNRVGVNHFSDLFSVARADLSKRFSAEVAHYLERILGNVQVPLSFYIPPDHFKHSLDLYYEVSNSQYLDKPLFKLYRLLARYLQLKDKLAAEVLISLHQRDQQEMSLSVSAAHGEYKADKWHQLSLLALESINLSAPVVSITLTLTRTVNKYAKRTDLFFGSQGDTSSGELVSALIAKLGKARVKGLGIKQDDRPEVANQLEQPLTACPFELRQTKLRPSILLPSPITLNEKVRLMPYPERVVTGWWDSNPVSRDYFIGRTTDGRWLWLFKDKARRWFVHGIFS